jgi:hypothetical protein
LEKNDLSITCWNKMVESVFNDNTELPIFNMSEDFQIQKLQQELLNQQFSELKEPFFD